MDNLQVVVQLSFRMSKSPEDFSILSEAVSCRKGQLFLQGKLLFSASEVLNEKSERAQTFLLAVSGIIHIPFFSQKKSILYHQEENILMMHNTEAEKWNVPYHVSKQ